MVDLLGVQIKPCKIKKPALAGFFVSNLMLNTINLLLKLPHQYLDGQLTQPKP